MADIEHNAPEETLAPEAMDDEGITPQVAGVILQFMDRVELKGGEAETFFVCQQKLRALLPQG